jgi:hypothetical protein
MKIRPVVADLSYGKRRTDRHRYGVANSRFFAILRPRPKNKVAVYMSMYFAIP